MSPTQKNTLIAVLAVAFVSTAGISLAVVKNSSKYKISAMQSQAAAEQKELRGANSGDRAQSAVPTVTPTGDVSAIIAAAKAQGEVDEKDNEDDPDTLSTLTDLDSAFAGGVQ